MLKRIPIWILAKRILLLTLLLNGANTNAIPVASFTANPVSGCSPLNVQFTNTSSGAVSYQWNLGNGNSSTLPNPSNLFTSPGNYTITLIVTDAFGNSDTATYQNFITVLGRPVADFTVDKTSDCPDNNSFTFTNLSSGGATSYLWDFGDGSTSTQLNPVHSYNFAGIFTVTLIAMNGTGCQDIKIINQLITIHPKPDPTITVADTFSCDPTTPFQFYNNTQNGMLWEWNFGDYTFSSLQNPTHVYPGQGIYFVSAIVTNTFGCKDTSDSPIKITVGLNNWADFYYSLDSGCTPLTVDFTNTNMNVASSLWIFGDGNTSTSAIWASNTYTQGGTYDVSLIVSTHDGCVDTVTKNNLIFAGIDPVVDFTYSNSTGCAPLSVQFTNTSTNWDSCIWYFGDGTTSNDTNPVHVYSNNGNYNVTLQCWGSSGCTSTKVVSNLVSITTPVAAFNGSPKVGCPPLTTSFTSISYSGPLTYQWDFGDGGTSTLANPSHTYTQSGHFDVNLVITDTNGCSKTISRADFIQTVNPATNYVPPPVTIGCSPLTTQFTDATPGATTWFWDFGDGTTSTLRNPVHTYSVPGTYTVALTTNSAGGGCEQTIDNFSTFEVNGGYAGFTHTDSQCPPYVSIFQDTSFNAVSWLWDFGDGTTSTSQHPVHTYTSPGYHSVSLAITTADGCTYNSVQNNIVYFEPFAANFFGIPLDSVFPLPVQFYANSVGATSFLWNFGDGDTSTLQNPIHTYQTNGAYQVTLTIANELCTLYYEPPLYTFGQMDTTPVDTGNGLVFEIQEGCAPLNVLFTDEIPNAVSWHWDFGDGDTSALEFPTHVYSEEGIYSVTLTTTDSAGTVEVHNMDSIIRVSGPVPGFSVDQLPNCQFTQVSITDSSSGAVSWDWDLGDGTFDTIPHPLHTYNTLLPNYIITQTVTDSMGCTASLSSSIFSLLVNPLLVSEDEVCGEDTVFFYTSQQNYASYYWDFGDGQTSTLPNPSHVYQLEGTYMPSLTVNDGNGCVSTFFVDTPIKVKLPVANFTTAGPQQGCTSLDVDFINTSVNADSYSWNFGDGTGSTLVNPSHSYLQAGSYDVTLTVYRGFCTDEISFPQFIRVDTAHADFTFTTDKICPPFTTQYQDLSTNAVSWQWYLGNGDTSNVQNPVHYSEVSLVFYPYLIITDINGCKDTSYCPHFPQLEAHFLTSGDSGCFPLTVTFYNTSSALAEQFYWDFGDGTTSNLPNPTHTYTQPGDYDITFVITSSWAPNCADTIFVPQKIRVKLPKADFTSTDLTACAPSLVTFTNLSEDADQFLWDFGDGFTSTNVHPSHIYNSPGVYSVKLIASNTLGCADSIYKEYFINVLGSTTNFTASDSIGCSPLTVTFIDLSTNAVTYSWNFGDGYSDTIINPTHTFSDTGSFTVSLVTIDTSGCISFHELPQKVVIQPSPDPAFSVNSNLGCIPSTMIFNSNATGNYTYNWSFGDGASSAISDPTHDYLAPGTYNVRLIVSDPAGCSDTSYLSQPLVISDTPVPQFIMNDAIGCRPFHVSFVNTSTNSSGANYLWDFGNGTISTDVNPSVDFTEPGTYNISLTVVNSNGCIASAIFPSTLVVPDSTPPPATDILSVSVVSDTSVKIIWQNNTAPDLAAYVIYRKDPLFNIYTPIHTETNLQNTTASSTSEYTDTGLNTLLYSYSYVVQAVDTCGAKIPVDQLLAHTTINTSSSRLVDDVLVTWTPYGGCMINSYELYRAGPGEQFSLVASLPSNTLSFLDTMFFCPVAYTYRVMATDVCGNTYTSYSDTSSTIPLNVLSGQVVDVVRSTVVDNQTVLTEWLQPELFPDKVVQFDLYRSTDNTNFYFLASVPSVQTDYMDYNVDVQTNHYYYKLLVINTCDVSESLSGNTSTIVLRGEMDETRLVHLYWTPYMGWEFGVDYYIIEQKDANGNWQMVKQLDGNVYQYDFMDH